MQWVALFFGSLFAGAIEWFTKYVGQRVAVYAAMFAIVTGLTVAFVASIQALYSNLGELGMPAWMLTAACWIVPGNADEVFGVYISARILRWAYWQNRALLRAKIGSV